MAASRKYPWEVWFNRARTILLRGQHYSVSQSSMIQIIRNNASLYGVRVRLQDLGDSIVIQVVGTTGLDREGNCRAVLDTDTTPVPP